jgi:hypothetical protein
MQIDDNPALSPVDAHKSPCKHAPGITVCRLYFYYVRAQVSELAAYAGAGKHRGEVCYSNILKWHHFLISSAAVIL